MDDKNAVLAKLALLRLHSEGGRVTVEHCVTQARRSFLYGVIDLIQAIMPESDEYRTNMPFVDRRTSSVRRAVVAEKTQKETKALAEMPQAG